MQTWKPILTIFGMLAGFGCTHDIEYAKPGGTKEDLQWDRYECIDPSGARMDRPMPGPHELDRCLARKGWRRVDK